MIGTILLLWALPMAVSGQIAGASEYNDLEREFESLAFGTRQNHHRHHRHRHFRHPHLRKRTALFEGPATTIPAPPPSTEGLLPGRHPAVERTLGNMDEEMHDLAGRQQAAALARGNLEKSVQKAVLHMNEAVSIKRKLARAELAYRAEDIKLRKLEDDRLRLDRTHGHLVSSLHHIMEPKIGFAETRLKQRQRMLRNLESKASEWKEKEEQYHAASLAVLEERKQNKLRLEAAAAAVEKARREKEIAKKQLEAAKHDVSYNVEGYRIAQAHAKGAAAEEKRGEKVVKEAEHSLKRLSSILAMEQRRVDESMALGKDRVQGKIRELEDKKERSHKRVKLLAEEYDAWQSRQRAYAERVAATKALTHVASSDYARRQQAVLDAAQEKVAYDAEADSDWAWNEWPGAGKGQDETDEVHLSAI